MPLCLFVCIFQEFSSFTPLNPLSTPWDTPIIITSSVGALREMQKIIISNLQLPCVQPPTFSYNFQLPHGCHGHGGQSGRGEHGGHGGQDRDRDGTGRDGTGQN